MEFKSTTEWDKQGNLCKLTQRKDRQGNSYLIGSISKTMAITVKKITTDWGKDKEGNQLWQVSLAPIKYEKVGSDNQEPGGDI